MEVYEKLTKQITETKYLNAENSYRYRPIMRCFYTCYEKLEYWLYKEDVYRELKNNEIFKDYTIEECERDLETLAEWKSLSKMQDTKNASSIEEFKNKKFRYQLSEYGVEIERMAIKLEEMEIKTASLEPKLFDRIRISINRLSNEMNDEDVEEVWSNLKDDFIKLGQNYQDFLKKFSEPKSEELMQSVLFLKFKSEIVKYLREFVKGYQKNVYYIKDDINALTEGKIERILDQINNHHQSTKILNNSFDFKKLKDSNREKLNSIFKWFTGTSNTISEGEKLMNTTGNIIVKITKYASSILELHGNMTSRREEIKHLCQTFDKLYIEEAHKYASVVFGISKVRHYKGATNINTDEVINAIDTAPIEIMLTPRSRARTQKVKMTPITDKTYEKQRQLEEYRKEIENGKQTIKKLIKNKKIVLSGDMNLKKIERRYIQRLLTSKNKKESEFGLDYNIVKKDGTCKITSEDGVFYLNSLEIEFEGEV